MDEKKRLEPTVHNWSEVIKKLNKYCGTTSMKEIEEKMEEMFKASLRSLDKSEALSIDIENLYLFKQEVVEIFNELYSIAPEEFIIKD
jgi:microsomal dipeptidase-like Zn-dependent dipeptidase